MENRKPRVTMEQIGAKLGISKAAVSLAMRGSTRVSAETQQRVRELAKQLGYSPSPMLSNLMAHIRASRPPSDHGTLAYLYSAGPGPFPDPTFSGRVFHAARAHAPSHGYRLEAINLASYHGRMRALEKILRNRGIDGFIVGSLAFSPAHLSMSIEGFSSIAVGYSLARPRMCRVCSDTFSGMLTALRSLAKSGYKRPGFFLHTRDADARTNHQFLSAFLWHQNQLSIDYRVPIGQARRAEDAPRMLIRWIKKYRPDVVLSFLIRGDIVLQNAGLSVPNDIGYVNLSVEASDPSVNVNESTYLSQSIELLGQTAVDRLVSRIYQNERTSVSQELVTLVPCQFVEGTTTSEKVYKTTPPSLRRRSSSK
jgi:LacI family transcriptional regulator